MHLLTVAEVVVIMLCFAVVTAVLVRLFNRKESNSEGFLAADRNVSAWQGAFSIAISWVWAPAIFVCSMQAYKMGLPGIFWFTMPNILCFFLFVPMAIRLRSLLPEGYTLPEFIYRRFHGSRSAHLAFLIIFFGYQLAAIISNAAAGGFLLHELGGIGIRTAILAMMAIALSYSLWSGLKASVLTDVIQMTMVLGLAFIIVPWCVVSAGGISAVTAGLGGLDGTHSSLFDPWIAFSMGIPMTISLLAGPLCDQMFFQRAMSVKKSSIAKTFVRGGLLFGLVPITLSFLGFIAAAQVQAGTMAVNDPQMVGAITIGSYLPKLALYAFALMAVAGLCSTLDSALCAASSLGSVDIHRRYMNPQATDRQTLMAARVSMLAIAITGTAIALCKPKILWVFFTSGALAAAGFFPTILALYWKRLPATGAVWAVLLSLLAGTPLSLYANITDNPHLIVAASIVSVLIGLVVCLVAGFRSNKEFDFELLAVAEPVAHRNRLHGTGRHQCNWQSGPKAGLAQQAER